MCDESSVFRPDIRHSVKNLSRRMVNPTESSLADLKRLVRYLKGYPDLSQVFAAQQEPTVLRVQVDFDHAGDAVTVWCSCCKHASNVQSTVALSTGESEYYALAKGEATALGLQSLLADLGLELPVVVESDSNSARGTLSRIGLGKARHIQTRFLWTRESGHGTLEGDPCPGVQMKATMERSGYIYLAERTKGQLKLRNQDS